MKKIIFFLFLFLNINPLSATQYTVATDFTHQELRQIALALLTAPQTSQVPGTQNPGPLLVKIASHSAAHAANITPNGTSFFRLNAHTPQVYRQLLTDVINNGVIVTGHENTPKKFSILWTIPLGMLGGNPPNTNPYGVSTPGEIGIWTSPSGHVQHVRKVKAVFSVISITHNDWAQYMPHVLTEIYNNNKGALITFFPIPDNFDH